MKKKTKKKTWSSTRPYGLTSRCHSRRRGSAIAWPAGRYRPPVTESRGRGPARTGQDAAHRPTKAAVFPTATTTTATGQKLPVFKGRRLLFHDRKKAFFRLFCAVRRIRFARQDSGGGAPPAARASRRAQH